MSRKKVDPRLTDLLKSNAAQNKRSCVFVLGPEGRNQVPVLWSVLKKLENPLNPLKRNRILWCYEKDLNLSSNRKKRLKQIKKLQSKGEYSISNNKTIDAFEALVTTCDVKWTYYRDSGKALGKTFDALVLQDYEALTPNVMARTMETVRGGGMIIILAKDPLAFQASESRFFRRMCAVVKRTKAGVVVLNDELDIVKKRSKAFLETVRSTENDDFARPPAPTNTDAAALGDVAKALANLCATSDQGKLVSTLYKSLLADSRTTVSLTAARGRGKSAAMGIALAGALTCDFANVLVTSPTPENLETLFEFARTALRELKFKENVDFVVNSTPEKLITSIDFLKDDKRVGCVQYVSPHDAHAVRASRADLLVIDEAASVPLPVVKKLLQNADDCLVWLSSTVHGYEGTGRSLSLKLLDSLRKTAKSGGIVEEKDDDDDSESNDSDSSSEDEASKRRREQIAQTTTSSDVAAASRTKRRALVELTLKTPIRYAKHDPVEKFLNDLLLLDVCKRETAVAKLPAPSKLELVAVDRDVLFSGKTTTERCLKNFFRIFVSSHYKNSPNDLLTMADTSNHKLFALVDPSQVKKDLPQAYCVLHVSEEGALGDSAMRKSTARGTKGEHGDMIPWTMTTHFQSLDFGKSSGARVVRIAVPENAQRNGYGKHAVLKLTEAYETGGDPHSSFESSDSSKNRPLLVAALESSISKKDWLGSAFGATLNLIRFWCNECETKPVYLRQSENETTAEHTAVVLKELSHEEYAEGWLKPFSADFARRFVRNSRGGPFSDLDIFLSFEIFSSAFDGSDSVAGGKADFFSDWDLGRIAAYAKNVADIRLVTDLLFDLAVEALLDSSTTQHSDTDVQRLIWFGLGVRGETVKRLSKTLKVPAHQLQANFNKSFRKLAAAKEKSRLEDLASSERDKEKLSSSASKRARLS